MWSRCGNAIDAHGPVVIMRAMVRNRFSRFETFARRLVEGSIGRLIGDEALTLQIATRLIQALEDSQRQDASPTGYLIALNPADLRSRTHEIPELESRLAKYVSTMDRHGESGKGKRVVIRLVPDETMRPGNVGVEASYERPAGGTTGVLNHDDEVTIRQLRLLDAFLIVNGRRHFALDKPLIRIGRRVDNDVIIDSPAVSRQHAHIRWRHGRFIIYDVGSRGGIQVNGEPIREYVLAPGDLISLAERVPLIYGEGLESRKTLSVTDKSAHDTLAYSNGDDV